MVPRAYATTLTCAVATDGGLAVAQIGDGIVVARQEDGELFAAVQPQHGEYANETFFLTMTDALEKITLATADLGTRKNGWMQVAGVFGTREAMKGKYLTRAAAAMFGLWGNTLEEAYYPESSVDENGEALDGSKHNYVLHFDADRLPRVNAFWSLSMYKLPEQLFVANPLERYVIGSATKGLKYNADGSLDLYIQKSSPGKDKESNWLPAHSGLFSLQARLYWPTPEMLEPLYTLPAIQKAK